MTKKALSSYLIRTCLFLAGLFIIVPLSGQSDLRVGLLPQINFNKTLGTNWKGNLKVESRQFILDTERGASEVFNYTYALTDISILLAKGIGGNGSLAGGYLIRLEEAGQRHRFIQQYAWVNRLPSFRLGHRILADQTFADYRDPTYRFRYRIGLDRSLNGQEVDRNEFYIKLTNEYIHIFQPDSYSLEIRLAAALGFVFTDNNKLEVGINYRLDSFIRDLPQHTLYLTLGWYLAL